MPPGRHAVEFAFARDRVPAPVCARISAFLTTPSTLPPHASRAIPVGNRPGRVLAWCIALALVALTIAYRFLTMGGPLGGFENDQFVTLSQAQQLVMGEWPVRDFIELGMPLTVLVSAIGQVAIGHTLFAEAVVTTVMLGVCAGVLFLLAWRASGSILLALPAALIQIAMAPRFYNYPKLLAYAIAVPVFWWYLDRPDRWRLTLVAIAGVIAFLLRHDHGLYVGLAAILTVAIAHWPDVRTTSRETTLLAAVAFALVLPYLAYIQMYDGLVPYFRAFVMYAGQSAGRTELRTPRFSFDWSLPFVTRIDEPRPAPRINVRWAPGASPSDRAARERDLGLTAMLPLNDDVSSYALEDWSQGRLSQLVRDPMVADTAGIDRHAFVIDDPQYTRVPTRGERFVAHVRSMRVLPGILRAGNAVPFLFYLMYAVPIAALLAVLIRARAAVTGRWNRPGAKIAVVAALALLLNRGFLRGSLPSRLADVSEVIGVLAVWVAALVMARSSRTGRVAAATATLMVVILAGLSVEAIEHVSSEIAQTGVTTSIGSVRARARDVYQALTATPPVEAWRSTTPGLERLAHYVHRCTRDDDRVLAVGYSPELFFMAQRRFAAGSVWILPDFFTADEEQRLMISRTRAHRVPIAITPPEPAYTEDYVPSLPRLTAMIQGDYREAGTVDFGRGLRVRVLTRRDLTPSGADAVEGLPCFS